MAVVVERARKKKYKIAIIQMSFRVNHLKGLF